MKQSTLITVEELKKKVVVSLPETPGSYQYYDKNGEVIYVGKAKNLKKRISSYFNKEHKDRKTTLLVSQIQDIQYIVARNEAEALLIENNLIKSFQPKYNILLKDGKSYPSLVLTKEEYPRLLFTRDLKTLSGEYFGPYPSVKMAKSIHYLLHDIFPIRTCKLPLNEKLIRRGKHHLCLKYHIKKCFGICVGLQTKEDYLKQIQEVREILKGNIHLIQEIYTEAMLEESKKMNFELAQQYKEKLDALQNYASRHAVVAKHINNVDVFSFYQEQGGTLAFINYLHISGGGVDKALTMECISTNSEEKKEALLRAIISCRDRFHSTAKEIILREAPSWNLGEDIQITIPLRGDKLQLLELSEENAKQHHLERLKQTEKLNPEQRTIKSLEAIKRDLGLNNLPFRIECFDNSNIHGSSPVASCIVFRMGKPAKKEYKKFHVKTVVGADDCSSMKEILTRRYKQLLESNAELPNLVVIDGGKGQLNAAGEVWKNLHLDNKIELIGLAKRLEEAFKIGEDTPIIINKRSETIQIIRHLRDEAHRFAINFHRNVRNKKQLQSELDFIEGIGAISKERLLQKFKSVRRIKAAKEDELAQIIGKSKAKILINYFNKNNHNENFNTASMLC